MSRKHKRKEGRRNTDSMKKIKRSEKKLKT